MPASVDPSLRIDPDESRPAQRGAGAGARAMAFVLLAAAAAGGVYWWYLDAQPTDPAPSTRAAPAAPTQPPAPAARALVQLGDFPRRGVATVDNLGRESAPSSLWPVVASPGRFEVDEAGEGAVPSAGNAARYATLVQAAEAMDAARAVDGYRRMYPLLQQAYRQLGLGDRSFNDRLLQVIDLLLATPEPAQPPRVHLLEVKGPVPSTRPWVRYQYVDPALEKLAAGQKILLRVGLDNERRLKNKLRELRRELLAPARPAS